MVVMDIEGKKLYLDGFLKSNLDIAKEVIKKDWDMVFAVDGVEGSGKSVFAQQCGFYLDNSLCIERIVFTPFDFKRAVVNAKPYQCVIYDEAYTGLSSRATMSMINRTLISMLAEIRQKNLFVFVVMPCFFDLDKYVALWRSRALFHIYTDNNFKRGFFSFFNSDRKKLLYILGKKYYDYSKPKANFFGSFTGSYVIDEKAYKLKKKNSLLDREKRREEQEIKFEMDKLLFERLQSIPDITHTLKIKILGMPSATYWVWLRKYNEGKEFEVAEPTEPDQ